MSSRREFLQALAAAALTSPSLRAFAQQRVTQDQLLRLGRPVGNVTIAHITDLHAQLKPVLFREPSVNLGVGEARGQLPHLTGQAFLDKFDIPRRSALAYALTSEDFAALAKDYGRLGGLDRIATVLKAIRAERPDRTLFLDGGDTWQNSYTSMVSKGQDMVDCMALLKPDAMTGHWEFTLGAERVKAITETLGFPFPGAEHPRHRVERAGVSADGDVRARRRQDRGDRPGLSLYADRQSALDDADVVVRHSRGKPAEQRRQGARGRRAARGAAVAQRLRCRQEARVARARHRRHPHRPHP